MTFFKPDPAARRVKLKCLLDILDPQSSNDTLAFSLWYFTSSFLISCSNKKDAYLTLIKATSCAKPARAANVIPYYARHYKTCK